MSVNIANAESTKTNISFFGLHIHEAINGTPWPAVPFGSWRLWDAYVSWDLLEPKQNNWDFSKLDRYVALASVHDTEILLPLGLSPTWASARPEEASPYGKGKASEPRDIKFWRIYVRKIAERYKGRITHYEIWNEVNEPQFYTGSPEMLVKLTCEANNILKSIDSANILVGPSVNDVGKHLYWHEAFLRLGGGKCVDAISHHFYSVNDLPEAIVNKIHDVRKTLDKFGGGKLPLWNTETGWWIGNNDGTLANGAFLNSYWKYFEEKDSDYLVARALILSRAEGLDRFYWYSWDHPAMGLIEPKSKILKPGANAFAKVVEWLNGAVIMPCQHVEINWSCEMIQNGKPLGWIAWTSKGQGVFKWPASKADVNEEYLSGYTDTIQVQQNQLINVDERPKYYRIIK